MDRDVHPDSETVWMEAYMYIGPGAWVSGQLAKTSYEYLVVSLLAAGMSWLNVLIDFQLLAYT